MAELGTLYVAARSFTPLAGAAETELLPRITALGSRIRRWVRDGALDGTKVDAASLEVLSLRAEWNARLEAMRVSVDYAAARAAVAADRQRELAVAIPRVLTGLRPAMPPPPLFVPVSIASGRRQPGTSPFLAPDAAAERISYLLRDGISASAEPAAAQAADLPSVTCADDPAALDTPVAVRVDCAALRAMVFAVGESSTYRIFTSRPLTAGQVWLASGAADAWWEVYEMPYESFRDALRKELAARGIVVS